MRISQLNDDCEKVREKENCIKDIVVLKSTIIQHFDSLSRRLSVYLLTVYRDRIHSPSASLLHSHSEHH